MGRQRAARRLAAWGAFRAAFDAPAAAGVFPLAVGGRIAEEHAHSLSPADRRNDRLDSPRANSVWDKILRCTLQRTLRQARIVSRPDRRTQPLFRRLPLGPLIASRAGQLDSRPVGPFLRLHR